jgi:glycosyltransferase involved in cell wall biosynthesis
VVTLPVLVDATSIPRDRGGVARYISGLLSGLEDEGRSIHVVAKRDDIGWLSDTAPGHVYRAAPRLVDVRPLRLLWEQIALPGHLRRTRATTLHCPHYTFPLALPSRCVVTLHDATFFSDPDSHGRLKRTFFRLWTRAARRLARATVTPSAATADEVARFVRSTVPNTVAHLGVDPHVFHPPTAAAIAAFRTGHGIDDDTAWIAFLGTIEPRKSVAALIRAHRAASADQTDVPPLLVSGSLGWDAEAVRLLTEAGDRPGAPLRYLGYLDLDELAAFLGGSSVVVYPSVGEGFGLPVLEAMSCGAAVLTTPRLAIPEVGGDAVAYTQPRADEIERDLRLLLDDDARRDRLSQDAVSRAADFTWAACATRHREAWSR